MWQQRQKFASSIIEHKLYGKAIYNDIFYCFNEELAILPVTYPIYSLYVEFMLYCECQTIYDKSRK